MYNPTKAQLICLQCPLKTCEPYECQRYKEEFRKLKGEKRSYGSIKRNSKKVRQEEMA